MQPETFQSPTVESIPLYKGTQQQSFNQLQPSAVFLLFTGVGPDNDSCHQRIQ